jgi:hypothetical protein
MASKTGFSKLSTSATKCERGTSARICTVTSQCAGAISGLDALMAATTAARLTFRFSVLLPGSGVTNVNAGFFFSGRSHARRCACQKSNTPVPSDAQWSSAAAIFLTTYFPLPMSRRMTRTRPQSLCDNQGVSPDQLRGSMACPKVEVAHARRRFLNDCFSPLLSYTTPSGLAQPPQDPAQRAKLQGEVAKALRHAFTGQK